MFFLTIRQKYEHTLLKTKNQELDGQKKIIKGIANTDKNNFSGNFLCPTICLSGQFFCPDNSFVRTKGYLSPSRILPYIVFIEWRRLNRWIYTSRNNPVYSARSDDSLFFFSVLLYIPVRFLAGGKHLKTFTRCKCFTSHPCNFFS